MIRYILIFGVSLIMMGVAKSQVDKPFDISKLPELRSNSRDITPVRKTNLHKRSDIRKNKAIVNTKRQELRKKRAMFQKQRMMQNRQRMLQRQKVMQQRQSQRGNRR
jgi:hypothetical protein